MATDSFEFTGKSVDEAIAEGLKTLNLSADDVEIEVLSKGSRGIFGLGSEPAHVRFSRRAVTPAPLPTAPSLTGGDGVEPEQEAPAHEALTSAQPAQSAVEASRPTPSEAGHDEESLLTHEEAAIGAATVVDQPIGDDEVEAIAVEFLTEAMTLMGFQATVQSAWKDGNDELSEQTDRYLLLNVQGADLGALVGRRGEALESLQYLLRLMVNQRLRQWRNLVVDVEGYKERRISQLKQLALRTASQVATTGRPVSLEPMPPNERRIVHIALRDHPDVYTESIGEGDRRKIHILVKQ